jgi:hypothetical protein
MQHRPEEVARYTVERNGGEYTTDIPDLLSLFGRKQLTDAARQEVREALRQVHVGTDPDLLVAHRSDSVRLFVLAPQRIRAAAVAPDASGGRSWVGRLRPRTWKGWVAYGLAALFIAVALMPDAKQSTEATPEAEAAAETEARASDSDVAVREERAALRRQREKLRRQRAQLRRERAQARRARARAHRVEVARRERERQDELAAQAAAAVPEPEQDAAPAAAGCHPSYDPCLDPNASDYDCDGGSGDGPEYTGFVTVKGPDDYGLDSDGDGTGCES